MKRRFIGFIMLLALIGTARGQTAYSYRYWFDNDISTQQSGSANGETTIELDIGSLAKGSVHALHLQGLDARGKWGAVRTTYFFLAKQGDPESATARYWFDNDETTAQTAPTLNGLIDLDISHMEIGLHAVHYQTFNAAGEASPVLTTYFYMNELQLALLSCQIWIDDAKDDALTFGLTEGDIVIEAEELSIGMHDLHVVLLDSHGLWLAEGTATFEVKEPSISIVLNDLIETFSSEKDLDFSEVPGLRAYTATGFHKLTGNVMMSRVNEVPAGEGLLLIGEPGTYEVPVRKSYSFYANLLVGTAESIVLLPEADGYTNYTLGQSDGEDGFFLANEGSTLDAGKAYLRVPSREAASIQKFRMLFDDNPDAIALPLEDQEAIYYNVSGQRIPTPKQGLNIIRTSNGTTKKVLVK